MWIHGGLRVHGSLPYMTLQARNNVTSLRGASEQLDLCSVGLGSKGARPALGTPAAKPPRCWLSCQGAGLVAFAAGGAVSPPQPPKERVCSLWTSVPVPAALCHPQGEDAGGGRPGWCWLGGVCCVQQPRPKGPQRVAATRKPVMARPGAGICSENSFPCLATKILCQRNIQETV